MKRIFVVFSLLIIAFSTPIHADCCCQSDPDYTFYIKAGSGVSFAQKAHVSAPPPAWNPAVQGYDSTLGNRGIADFAIGCELMRMVDVEVSVSARTAFKYRKFQTPLSGGDSYTREFDLTVIPILFSINLLGRDIPCLNWDLGCGTLYPIVGAGVGVSNLLITNFRTTGLPPSGDSDPFASFSAENQHTLRQNFTYTALIGFEYNHNDRFAIATGYRWFDAGQFKGPKFQRVGTGAAVDVAEDAWKMRFRANEWFIELKILL